jgi:hypothetical protein
MQLSFNASIRREIFNDRNFVRFGLPNIATRVDTYIIDSLRTGRRLELEENDVSDTHFRVWYFKGRFWT